MFFGTLKAQLLPYQKPDYQAIKNKVTDSSSNFYFPRLMEKYKKFDTTITDQELKYLYFGYLYSKDYQRLWYPKYREEINKYLQTQIVPEDYYKILGLAQKSLEDFPFDLEALAVKGYIHRLKKDEELLQKVSNIYTRLLDVIFGSGNGSECDLAYHVITIDNEYSLINILEIEYETQKSIGKCNVFNLKNANMPEIYFTIHENDEQSEK